MDRSHPLSQARRYPSELGLAGAAVLVLFSAYVTYALLSSGVYFDDDIQHYLIAKYSWQHPHLLLDYWGRPAFTILYAPAAALGFTATRLFSALLAAGVCASTGYLAWLYGLRRPWLAIALTGLQPDLMRQGFSALTELIFALLLCWALIAYRRERWGLMALIVGWLPLARYESLPLVLIFLVILGRKRQLRWIPLLGLPLLIQNSFQALWQDNLLLLLFPFSQIIERQGDTTPIYAPGGPLYYILRSPYAFGAAIFLLGCYGMLRMRPGLLHASVLIVLGVLSVTYAFLPGAAIAGYSRHLATVAPEMGVLAAFGLSDLLGRVPAGQRRRGLIAGFSSVTALLIVAQLALQVQPFQLTPIQQLTIEAGQWIRAQRSAQVVVSANPWLNHIAELDILNPNQTQVLSAEAIDQARPGTWFVWDSHYAKGMLFKIPLATLQDDPRLSVVKSWRNQEDEIHLYQKR